MTPLEAGLDVIQNELLANPDDVQMCATARGMFVAYDATWPRDRYRILEVEGFRLAPMPTLTEGKSRKRRGVSLAGKLDVLLLDLQTGNRVLLDHKTTSENIEEADANYWRHLVVDTQSTHYSLLEFLYGNRVDSILWDAIRKPGIRITQKETPEQHSVRVSTTMMTEQRKFIQRRTVARMREDIAEYLEQLADEITELRQDLARDYHPKNPKSCFNHHSPCGFLGICSNYDTPDSDRWTRATSKHPELPVLNTKDEVITNSRMNTRRECRRKHHYKYNLGIVRSGEPRSLALTFGDLWHRTLEAYFNTIKENQTA